MTKRLGEIPDGRGKVHVTYFFLHNSGLFCVNVSVRIYPHSKMKTTSYQHQACYSILYVRQDFGIHWSWRQKVKSQGNTVKPKFYGSSFLIATSYAYQTRILATFRPSRHAKMVWRAANMSATSRACDACGIWRTTWQTDKLTTASSSLRGCYEETASVEAQLWTFSTTWQKNWHI